MHGIDSYYLIDDDFFEPFVAVVHGRNVSEKFSGIVEVPLERADPDVYYNSSSNRYNYYD